MHPPCKSRTLGRRRVPALYYLPDLFPAVLGGHRLLLLNLRCLASQLIVLNYVFESFRVVPIVQMVQPRLIIHSICHLQERHQVLRPQIQLRLRSAKIETHYAPC